MSTIDANMPIHWEYFIAVKRMQNKIPQDAGLGFVGGSEQIRTAVKGFADLCLATRPPNHTGDFEAINHQYP